MRNAQNKNVGSLPFKFWNTPQWNWTFKKQVFLANGLLKTYSEAALLRAIQKLPTIFSLKNQRLLPILKRCEKEVQAEKAERLKRLQEQAQQPVIEKPTHRKASFGKQSVLQKLRGTHGEKKV